jgi:tellurite resistance protein TehA-like permease
LARGIIDNVPDETIHPPVVLLAVAAASIAASAVLLTASGKAVNLIGYGLAMILAALAVVSYRTIDSRSRTRAGYVLPRFAKRVPPTAVTAGLLVLGTLVGAAHVWRFADAVAR